MTLAYLHEATTKTEQNVHVTFAYLHEAIIKTEQEIHVTLAYLHEATTKTEQNVHVTFAHLHESTTTATEQDFRVTFTYTRLINETGRSRDVFLPTRSYYKKNDMLSGITCGTKYSLPLSLSPVWELRSISLIEKFELWNI
jgi:hypothetical protein